MLSFLENIPKYTGISALGSYLWPTASRLFSFIKLSLKFLPDWSLEDESDGISTVEDEDIAAVVSSLGVEEMKSILSSTLDAVEEHEVGSIINCVYKSFTQQQQQATRSVSHKNHPNRMKKCTDVTRQAPSAEPLCVDVAKAAFPERNMHAANEPFTVSKQSSAMNRQFPPARSMRNMESKFDVCSKMAENMAAEPEAHVKEVNVQAEPAALGKKDRNRAGGPAACVNKDSATASGLAVCTNEDSDMAHARLECTGQMSLVSGETVVSTEKVSDMNSESTLRKTVRQMVNESVACNQYVDIVEVPAYVEDMSYVSCGLSRSDETIHMVSEPVFGTQEPNHEAGEPLECTKTLSHMSVEPVAIIEGTNHMASEPAVCTKEVRHVSGEPVTSTEEANHVKCEPAAFTKKVIHLDESASRTRDGDNVKDSTACAREKSNFSAADVKDNVAAISVPTFHLPYATCEATTHDSAPPSLCRPNHGSENDKVAVNMEKYMELVSRVATESGHPRSPFCRCECKPPRRSQRKHPRSIHTTLPDTPPRRPHFDLSDAEAKHFPRDVSNYYDSYFSNEGRTMVSNHFHFRSGPSDHGKQDKERLDTNLRRFSCSKIPLPVRTSGDGSFFWGKTNSSDQCAVLCSPRRPRIRVRTEGKKPRAMTPHPEVRIQRVPGRRCISSRPSGYSYFDRCNIVEVTRLRGHSPKKPSKMEGGELKSIFITLEFEKQFKQFAKYGMKRSTGIVISELKSERWFRQANILDRNISPMECSFFFRKIAGTGLVLTIQRYMHFLHELAKYKEISVETLMNKLINCGSPDVRKPRMNQYGASDVDD